VRLFEDEAVGSSSSSFIDGFLQETQLATTTTKKDEKLNPDSQGKRKEERGESDRPPQASQSIDVNFMEFLKNHINERALKNAEKELGGKEGKARAEQETTRYHNKNRCEFLWSKTSQITSAGKTKNDARRRRSVGQNAYRGLAASSDFARLTVRPPALFFGFTRSLSRHS